VAPRVGQRPDVPRDRSRRVVRPPGGAAEDQTNTGAVPRPAGNVTGGGFSIARRVVGAERHSSHPSRPPSGRSRLTTGEAVLARSTVEQRRREDGIVSVRDGNGEDTGTGDPSGPLGASQLALPRRAGRSDRSAWWWRRPSMGSARSTASRSQLARIEATEAASVRAQGVWDDGCRGRRGAVRRRLRRGRLRAALALVMPTWVANLIVAAVFVGIAVVLVLVGRHALRTAPAAAERTRETLKEDARWRGSRSQGNGDRREPAPARGRPA